jgi:hypothetical protein
MRGREKVLRACLYRLERPLAGTADKEIVCLAGGNHRLGLAGGDARYLASVCGQCPIPEALSEEAKPCLYLLPIRIFGEIEIKTLYQCRALYRLNPKRADRSLSLHFPKACEWWFPHPLEFLPPGTEWHTHLARGLYLGEIAEPPPPWNWGAPPPPEPLPRWRRLLSLITPK